jgi:formylglycine-generating enzyme required for sulfatase activity
MKKSLEILMEEHRLIEQVLDCLQKLLRGKKGTFSILFGAKLVRAF